MAGLGVRDVAEWNARNHQFKVVFTVDGEKREHTAVAESIEAARKKPQQWFPGQKVRVTRVTKLS